MKTYSGPSQNYYFPDKLKKEIELISSYPITIIEAPSGFGKTTAVRAYLKDCKADRAEIYYYTCLGEPSVVVWQGICNLLKKIDHTVAVNLAGFRTPSEDSLYKIAENIRSLECRVETYFVIDNLHLFRSNLLKDLINIISSHGDNNLHFVLITQPLGLKHQLQIHNNNIYIIDALPFFFDRASVKELCKIEEIEIPENDLESLYMNTEGWIAAIRLQLIAYLERGKFSFEAGIEQLVEEAIWGSLNKEERDFLVSLSVLERFNINQAAIMVGADILSDHLAEILRKSDFIRRIPDRQEYVIHGIFKDYLLNILNYRVDKETKNRIYKNAGLAKAAVSGYCQAAEFYYKTGDFQAIMSLPITRAYLDEMKDKDLLGFFLKIVRECPEEIMKAHPMTLLSLGYMAISNSFTDEYSKISNLISQIIRNKRGYSPGEIDKIRGEYLLLTSLESFNDLGQMSDKEKQAWDLLKGPSKIVESQTPYIFSATSFLATFMREPGLKREIVRQMKERKEIFTRLTGGNGAGSAYLLEAEALLVEGRDQEAEILCFKALHDARSFKQVDITVCADLILIRIALMRGDVSGFLSGVDNLKRTTQNTTDQHIVNLVEHALSIVGMMSGVKEFIAPWLYNIDSIKKVVYAPIVPITMMFHLRLLQMEGRDKEFYALCQLAMEEWEKPEGKIKYLIPYIYQNIFMAMDCQQKGGRLEGQQYLKKALSLALEDKIYLPFAQTTGMDEVLLSLNINAFDCSHGREESLKGIIQLYKRQQKGQEVIRHAIMGVKSPLTPREREIALLARDRLTAKEIGVKLYISEQTVRTTLKNVYSKLEINSKSQLSSVEF